MSSLASTISSGSSQKSLEGISPSQSKEKALTSSQTSQATESKSREILGDLPTYLPVNQPLVNVRNVRRINADFQQLNNSENLPPISANLMFNK